MATESESASPARDTTGKRYLDIANALIADITGSVYVVGSLLPTEHELASIFDASRSTVRAALTVLQDRGYITRRKAIGSQVRSADPGAFYTQSVDALEDLVSVAAREVRVVREVRKVRFDRTTARRLGAPFDSEWIRFSGPRVDVKTHKGISWTDIYVDSKFEAIIDQVKSHPEALVSAMLEREFNQNIFEVNQAVNALLVDETLAKELGMRAGEAGLKIIRQYRNEKQKILEISETIYPAENVTVLSQLRRRKS